ncbi:MAG: copper amine oxidase N-terminal domain-containing protein, partial [Firmicutes bacterium]|nr:copper amine oxidase N-terminal domain-containing protein [Bacillota bacterium]
MHNRRITVLIIIILTVILSGANFTLSQGGTQETETKKEKVIMLNNNQLDLEYKHVFNENGILIPLFPVFEELGAVAFYNEDTNSIICLTGDGDYIKHRVGTDLIEINGQKTYIESSSIIENKQILIPTGFISKAFPKYALHFEKDHGVNIFRPVHYNEHSQIAEEILEYSIQLYFIPELYADYLDYRANNQDVS